MEDLKKTSHKLPWNQIYNDPCYWWGVPWFQKGRLVAFLKNPTVALAVRGADVAGGLRAEATGHGTMGGLCCVVVVVATEVPGGGIIKRFTMTCQVVIGTFYIGWFP